MIDSDEVTTLREEIKRYLVEIKEPESVDSIIRNLQTRRTYKQQVDDLNHAIKSLKGKGIKFKINPSRCKKCGFGFKQDKLEIKIPSKCPKCKSELIESPIIQKK